ncbi:MAG: fibrillarin-like rRNA/tRNA 2'-O-methyltransferase [Thermoplasmata archaeon]|nr:fibrillarin-like rRNA/tRNA 2'-O-methyltransferase [Thermoplasmata archaeon]
MEPTEWAGVYRSGKELYTLNADPGHRVYGEELRTEGGKEYRQWDPFRSKLAAYLLKGAPSDTFRGVRRVLYLGGAHGTTVSHLSDVLPEAALFVIEKSPTAFAPLLALARRRSNILPILADAQLPERYGADVGPVDLLYQDVAQRAQAMIFGENAEACLAAQGLGLLMLKVKSVTQARPAAAVLAESRREVERHRLHVRSTSDLAPFSREHLALAAHW